MHRFKKFGASLIGAAAFTCLGLAPLYAQCPGGESAKDPLLDTVNSEFRVQYQQALAVTLAEAGPVILEEGDNLILVRNGERAAVPVKQVEYHELKAVAHIPVALFVMLSFPQGAGLTDSRQESLRGYRELMEKARASLPRRHFTSAQLSRQQEIFTASFDLLADVLAEGQVKAQKLATFMRQMAPLLLTNVADATALEMRELYAAAA